MPTDADQGRMVAYLDRESRSSAHSGFACQFVVDGVMVEVLVGEPQVMAWDHDPRQPGMRLMKKVARTIARVQISFANASPGESWRVVVDQGTTTCNRVAEA